MENPDVQSFVQHTASPIATTLLLSCQRHQLLTVKIQDAVTRNTAAPQRNDCSY
jgi:hypothetical protein